MNPMIWVIDDDASIRFVFDKALEVNNIGHRLFENGDEALEALKQEVPDVIVSDIRMPGISGLNLIKTVHETDEDIPFIIMTAHSDLTAAIDSYESGSFEYLPKPFDIEQAVAVIRRAAVHRFNVLKLKNEREGIVSGTAAVQAPAAEIIGKSAAMQEVFKFIGRVSHTSLPVLINGEVGTGREQVALALHNHGAHPKDPFISINLASLQQESVTRELFGSSADQGQCALSQAAGGTLFINEISYMPKEAQTRLLQLLVEQEHAPQSVGERKGSGRGVRVIAATSEDLEEKIAAGEFIADLYYRLNVLNITMPPLRERNNDIPMLAKHFLSQFALESRTEPKKLTSEVLVFLCRQSWPGNVRQLKNLCKYLTIMVNGRDIQLVDLPSEFLHQKGTAAKALPAVSSLNKESSWQDLLRKWADGRLKAGERDILGEAVPEFERVMLQAALSFTGNHKQEAAKLLGWGRNTLTRKIKELNLELKRGSS